MSTENRRYLAKYYNEGWYGITIYAKSEVDAKQICTRHLLQYDGGPILFTLHWPFAWAGPYVVWFMNTFMRKDHDY